MGQRIVVNRCFGGFGLSPEALSLLQKRTGQAQYNYDIKRDDPELVKIIEELGTEANGEHAELEVVEIPDGVEWEIEEYDGTEWVSEKHRRW